MEIYKYILAAIIALLVVFIDKCIIPIEVSDCCSDEKLLESKDIYSWWLDETNNLRDLPTKDVEYLKVRNHYQKVIATNSPTLTPNCYFSEDRVKEFVDYWNKWEELPKFKVLELPKNIGGFEQGFELVPTNKITINDEILIKWLKKEESKNNANNINFILVNALRLLSNEDIVILIESLQARLPKEAMINLRY